MKRRRNPYNVETPSNDPVPLNLGLTIARKVMRMLPDPSVIGGGLAMQLYGFQRNTKDVDILAGGVPSDLVMIRPVTFGGGIYFIKYRGKKIPVDVIVRNDAQSLIYQSAIQNAVYKRGYPVPSPEHMAVIKYRAGRDKDMLDLRYLLGNRLFSIKKAGQLIRSLYAGAGGDLLAEDFESDMNTELALMKLERRK